MHQKDLATPLLSDYAKVLPLAEPSPQTPQMVELEDTTLGNIITNISNFNPNDQNRDSLQDYFTVANHYHKEDLAVTWGEIFKELGISTFCYGIGFVNALMYDGPARGAAEGDPVKTELYRVSSIGINTLVSGFFCRLMLDPPWEAIAYRLPKPVRDAVYGLKNQSPELWAKFVRGVELALKLLPVVGPNAAASLISYFIDIKESDHPFILSLIIFVAAFTLQFKGIATLFYQVVPLVTSPFKNLYRKFSPSAQKNYFINTTLESILNSYKEALKMALEEYLKILQNGESEKVAHIHALLNKENLNIIDTLKLLILLFKLIPTDKKEREEFFRSPLGYAIWQLFQVIITTLSLVGLFVFTKIGVEDFFNLDEGAKNWIITISLFAFYAATSYVVSWEIFDQIYSMSSYAGHFMSRTWEKTENIFDFVRSVWQGRNNLVKLPLFMQQNPGIMLMILGAAAIITGCSVPVSTYFNKQTLSPILAKIVYVPTAIISWGFNFLPTLFISETLQRFGTRLIGSQRNKDQIRTERFLNKMIKMEMHPRQFATILNSFGRYDLISAAQIDTLNNHFTGNKSIEELWGPDHPFAKLNVPLRVALPKLLDSKIEELGVKFGNPPDTTKKATAKTDFFANSKMKTEKSVLGDVELQPIENSGARQVI